MCSVLQSVSSEENTGCKANLGGGKVQGSEVEEGTREKGKESEEGIRRQGGRGSPEWRASQDRQWMEKVRAHCERGHDDLYESSQVQERRIHEQRERRTFREAWEGKKVEGGQGIQGPRKMMKNKANGPADCLVSDMLQELPVDTVFEITHQFGKRFTGECRALAAWKILLSVFLQKLDAKSEKESAVVVGLLQEELEPIESSWCGEGCEL